VAIHVTPIPKLTEFAAPALTLGTANAAGSAITTIATNSTLLAFDTTVPTTISAYGASAATGSAVVASRRDHVHGMLAAPVLKSAILTGSRTASAGSGDQALTGAGFSPLGAISLGDAGNTALGSWGMSDAAGAERAMSSRNTTTFFLAGRFIDIDNSGTNTMYAVLKSYDADGITITWTKGGSGDDVTFSILVLGVG